MRVSLTLDLSIKSNGQMTDADVFFFDLWCFGKILLMNQQSFIKQTNNIFVTCLFK